MKYSLTLPAPDRTHIIYTVADLGVGPLQADGVDIKIEVGTETNKEQYLVEDDGATV